MRRFISDTRAYVERCRAEGRTTKEIRRCLRRCPAHHLYQPCGDLHRARDHTAPSGQPPAICVPNFSGQHLGLTPRARQRDPGVRK
ncbi:MAG: hypothetical protein EKK51_31175 [Mycolicibacterium sp.]|nr:MAG: hypothetical protein EKK51_31175 [Mycolicibacterium sp.]